MIENTSFNWKSLSPGSCHWTEAAKDGYSTAMDGQPSLEESFDISSFLMSYTFTFMNLSEHLAMTRLRYPEHITIRSILIIIINRRNRHNISEH